MNSDPNYAEQMSKTPTTSEEEPPIRVAIVNDFPVVVQGVARLLEGDSRLRVVEVASLLIPGDPVDIALYDAFATPEPLGEVAKKMRQDGRFGKIVAYTWNVASEQLRHAEEAGFDGVLSKQLGREELVEALLRLAAGEHIVEPLPPVEDDLGPDWPGRSVGLSARESEVVSLITQGLTNEQIANATMLSINSVKSYIRSAYQKMGVKRRSQAVLWGVRNGMAPRPNRTTCSWACATRPLNPRS